MPKPRDSPASVRNSPPSAFLFSWARSPGLAAMMNIVQSPQVDPKSGTGLELKAIAAAVVGGVAISGGRGNLWGVFVGLLLLACVNPALTYLHVEAYWEKAIQGAIILLAVVADGMQNSAVKTLSMESKQSRLAGGKTNLFRHETILLDRARVRSHLLQFRRPAIRLARQRLRHHSPFRRDRAARAGHDSDHSNGRNRSFPGLTPGSLRDPLWKNVERRWACPPWRPAFALWASARWRGLSTRR